MDKKRTMLGMNKAELPDDVKTLAAVRRFLVLMLVRVAAQRLAQADELRELAAKAGAA